MESILLAVLAAFDWRDEPIWILQSSQGALMLEQPCWEQASSLRGRLEGAGKRDWNGSLLELVVGRSNPLLNLIWEGSSSYMRSPLLIDLFASKCSKETVKLLRSAIAYQ